MDVNMPILDGYQATEKIVKLHSKRRIKQLPTIVALTAYSTETTKEKCESVGMKHFLVKPVNTDELDKILQNDLNIKI